MKERLRVLNENGGVGMNSNHFELEQELKRRQLNIERGSREAWKFHERNRNVNRAKRGRIKFPFLSGLLQMLKK
jgi:hypothetical protein